MPDIPTTRRRVLPTGDVGGVIQPLSTADTGQGLEAQGLGQLGRGAIQLGQVFGELAIREQRADDSIATANASTARQSARDSFAQFQIDNPDPSTWEEGANQIWEGADSAVGELQFSDRVNEREQIRHDAEGQHFFANAKIQATQSKVNNAVVSTEAAFINSFSQGAIDSQENQDAYMEALLNKHSPEVAKTTMADTIEKAERARSINAVNAVHAAIEAASNPVTGGDFGLAKEAAKSSLIDEKTQTSLRTTIKTAEAARKTQIKQEQTELVNKTTSDTIREYFAGDMTVAELNRRHEARLLKDSEFKSMMTGLTETTPEHSDPFAAGRIRAAETDFALGSITREEADKVILDNYTKLDGPDRSGVVTRLEDVEAKIIANAKSNAYSEGKRLMSRRFVGIQSEEDLIDLFGTGLSDAEKKRINRLWTAEVANRDLYERAVDDRFTEMRRAGISDIKRFTDESLRILQSYKRRKTLELEDLELEVGIEERQILSGEFGAGGFKAGSKEETAARGRLAELAQIREQRRKISGTTNR